MPRAPDAASSGYLDKQDWHEQQCRQPEHPPDADQTREEAFPLAADVVGQTESENRRAENHKLRRQYRLGDDCAHRL
jgi:hypothetical protein